MDALKKGVVFGGTGGSLFVGMVAEDLLAVSALDLFGGCAVAVFGQAKDSVVVLALYGGTWLAEGARGKRTGVDWGSCGECTFQSLASRCSINGSSASLISPASSSSIFFTFSWAWMRSSSENVRL